MRLVSLFITCCITGLSYAQINSNDVLFTVDNEPVKAKEFIRVYNKNLDLVKDESQKDIDGYLLNWSFCSHPNQNGYEWIANEMVKGIKENHPKWYSKIENENIEWEFQGKPRLHKPNVI